ncbi:MAG TPA: hypothetical protein VGM06_09165 [Polyangiaceae bacterium]|jgi:peptidoglycan/LPS O-acetylase OafA/YrhL
MAKRHLPLLQPARAAEEDRPRSPWQWVGFGAAAIFTVWVPLSILAVAASSRLVAAATDPAGQRKAVVLALCVYALDLALGAFAGGYLVGRWGPSGVGVREGAKAGLGATIALAVLAWAMLGATPNDSVLAGLVVVAVVAPCMAAWGARAGLRRR